MSLSTLIVQREIASIREVEEALARQVLYGGDLVTNLLEVCRLDEAQLLPVVAESLGLPPAPPGELPRPQADAQKLVFVEVAVERNLAPLTIDANGLTIAVAEPLSADVEQELAFTLALPIAQKIAPLVRIRQALARDYGAPLDRRLQRLLKRMMTPGPRTTSSSYPPMRTHSETKLGAPRPPDALPPAPTSKRPEEAVRPSIPAGGGPQTLLRNTETAAPRPLRRRRGALTLDVARAELEEATERDVIFDLVFEFARQYFDYTAVFTLHGDLAEGRDAFGDGSSREKVMRIGVPLDLPSILARAKERKAVVKRVPSAEGLDAVLMSDLGRSGKTQCIVLPIVVRTRVVAMLLGDGGESGIDEGMSKDVEAIVAAATAAFERLIVHKKLKGSAPPAGMPGLVMPDVSVAPPPTMLSEPYKPNPEDLVPASIRDLLADHPPPVWAKAPSQSSPAMSKASETMREGSPPAPPAVASSPVLSSRRNSDLPPPENVLAVRRPSGRPIPREEPKSSPNIPAVGLPAPPAGPASTAPKSRGGRRAQAPKLEFGVVPPPPSSSFGSESFVGDDVERRLLAEIHGRRFENEPKTSRDDHPPVLSPSQTPLDPTSGPPASPKAESPPPMKVAPEVQPHKKTQSSPGALPVIRTQTTTMQSTVQAVAQAKAAAEAAARVAAQREEAEAAAQRAVHMAETPAVPPVSLTDETPAVPPVSLTATMSSVRSPFAALMEPSPPAPYPPAPSSPQLPVSPVSSSPASLTEAESRSRPTLPPAPPSEPPVMLSPLSTPSPLPVPPSSPESMPDIPPSPSSVLSVPSPASSVPFSQTMPSSLSPFALLKEQPPIPSTPPISEQVVSGSDADVTLLSGSPTPFEEEITQIDETPRFPSKPPTPWPSEAGEDLAPVSIPKLVPMPDSRVMPPSEQQISVAAHRPPSSRSDHTRVLPSVIVDVVSEYVGLVDRLLEATKGGQPGGQTADDAEAELVRAGGYAMPAIMAKFPGPITIERERLSEGVLPRVAECGPILRVVAGQRRTALPFVLAHVEDPDTEKRFWATYLLTELVYPDVVDPILLRIFDEEARVRRAARAAARSFAEAHPATLAERLTEVAKDGDEKAARRVLAIQAMGEMRDPSAVPVLIPLLADAKNEVASAVRSALVMISRQDFGLVTAKWQAWWTANKERHRIEWLIDALMHEQAALRATASEELKITTKEYFGYYDDLPKRERERAQSRYREWWNNIGRIRFSRSSASRG